MLFSQWKKCTGEDLTIEDEELIRLLQRAHDRSRSPEDHKERLLQISKSHGFTIPEIPKKD